MEYCETCNTPICEHGNCKWECAGIKCRCIWLWRGAKAYDEWELIPESEVGMQ